MTAPITLAGLMDGQEMKAASKSTGLPPSAPKAVPDSVPVALFGDDKSPQVRAQYMARVAAVIRNLAHGGLRAVATEPPPPAAPMRATTQKERGKQP